MISRVNWLPSSYQCAKSRGFWLLSGLQQPGECTQLLPILPHTQQGPVLWDYDPVSILNWCPCSQDRVMFPDNKIASKKNCGQPLTRNCTWAQGIGVLLTQWKDMHVWGLIYRKWTVFLLQMCLSMLQYNFSKMHQSQQIHSTCFSPLPHHMLEASEM